jgi:putative ABC transport system substrate-binding protein
VRSGEGLRAFPASKASNYTVQDTEHQWRRPRASPTANRIPSMYFDRVFVDAGGLMSYGPDFPDTYRRAANHVDKIPKGAKPGDLSVERPTKIEFVVNLKASRALGLTVPQSILLQATQVIE